MSLMPRALAEHPVGGLFEAFVLPDEPAVQRELSASGFNLPFPYEQPELLVFKPQYDAVHRYQDLGLTFIVFFHVVDFFD